MKKHKIISLVTGLLALKMFSFAADISYEKTYIRKTTPCEVNGKTFALTLSGKTELYDEEEQIVGSPYLWIKQNRPVLGLPIVTKRGYDFELSFLDPKQMKVESSCVDTVAWPVANGKIMVLVTADNRPIGETIVGLVYDLNQEKVIVTDENVANSYMFKTKKPIQINKDGFLMEVFARPGTDTSSFGNITEDFFTYWLSITYKNNRITKEVDTAYTWKHSKWGNYFSSKIDFEKTFGYNIKGKSFPEVWVFERSDGCFQPSFDREIHSEWFCKENRPNAQPGAPPDANSGRR